MDPDTVTYVTGGRLGDLLHVMWVVRRRWEKDGRRGVLVMSDRYGGDSFSRGLRATFEEVRPLVEGQEYIARVELDAGDFAASGKPVTNLNLWRHSARLGRADWTTLLSEVYGLERADPAGGWLSGPAASATALPEPGREPLDARDAVVVHQAYRSRIDPSFPWESVLLNNRCVFVTCNRREYDDFAFRHLVPCHEARDLVEMAAVVAAAKGFVGNQSAPLALAAALGKVCYCQLYAADRMAYVGLGSHVYYESRLPPAESISLEPRASCPPR